MVTFFPHGETAYVLAHLDGAEDSHGNPVDSWAAEPGVAIKGCGFAPGGSTESGDNRTVIATNPQLFCPPGASITAKDRVKVRGLVFEVVGDPADWKHPMTGWDPGVVVNLERVAG